MLMASIKKQDVLVGFSGGRKLEAIGSKGTRISNMKN